jgi:hypothetical protein
MGRLLQNKPAAGKNSQRARLFWFKQPEQKNYFRLQFWPD